jgi:hypothetical protein
VQHQVPRLEPLAAGTLHVAHHVHGKGGVVQQPRRGVEHVRPLPRVPGAAGAQHQRLPLAAGLAPVREAVVDHADGGHTVLPLHERRLVLGGRHHRVGRRQPRARPAAYSGFLRAAWGSPSTSSHQERTSLCTATSTGAGNGCTAYAIWFRCTTSGRHAAGERRQPLAGRAHVRAGAGHPLQPVAAPDHLHAVGEPRERPAVRLPDHGDQHLVPHLRQRAGQDDRVVPDPPDGIRGQEHLHRPYTRSSTAATRSAPSTSGSYTPPVARRAAQSAAARAPHPSGGAASVSHAVPRYASATKS